MAQPYDYAIVGAGMAGASLAAELAGLVPASARIVLLEAEDAPGYHTTGRSAAFYEECYGGPDIVPLTRASGAYLREHGFLSPRGALYIARDADAAKVDAFFERFAESGACFERIGRDALVQRLPGLKENWTHAIWQPECADIDVAGLHQHYLARAGKAGVELHCRARVERLEQTAGGWQLSLAAGAQLEAKTIINAAGAWADSVATRAGARPLGITPLRRTVAVLATDPAPPAELPLTLDISGQFYFRPDGARLWLSPHDETPSEPCDAAAEELDVATAIDRFGGVVDWQIRRLEHRWAGLRSFAPDRLPVFGYDPQMAGFFWFAGQGGYGIQTAPAAARLGAQLLTDAPRDAMTAALDPHRFSAGRFLP